MTKIRVVAVVVDTQQLTLYKDDGNTVSILQGDPRVHLIVEQVLPIVENHQVAEVDLEFPNHYKEFEQQSGGLVRLFRTTKKAVAHIFGAKAGDVIPEGDFGVVPNAAPRSRKSSAAAVQEIIANASPVASEAYAQSETSPADTMIAVVGTGKDTKIIPGVEALVDQFAHSARNRNTVGVQNLLKRMAGYIDKRAHSVEDLLRFLEKGDLPIASDGSIIAYKKLYKKPGSPGYFTDPHTRKVGQRVGSYVCVEESLVDKNRRNECSSGLHIGRRGYMGSFQGDTLMLCKIAPEDIIVVPHNDPNKVRVMGYHIIAELTSAQFDAICRNKPMTEQSGGQQLLGKVLRGNHIARIEEVRITGQRGEGIVVTQLIAGKKFQRPVDEDGPVPRATALDDKANDTSTRADPKQISARVTDLKTGGGRMARALELLKLFQNSGSTRQQWQAAVDLVAHKRASKVTWTTLGISDKDAALVTAHAAQAAPVAPIVAKAPKPVKRMDVETKPGQPRPAGFRQVKARQLWDIVQLEGSAGNGPAKRIQAAKDLIAFKKGAKVSWDALGLAPSQVAKVLNIAEHGIQTVKPKAPPKVKTVIAKAPPPATKTLAESKALSKLDQVRIWRDQLDASTLDDAHKAVVARQMLDSRRSWKKSWAALGLPSTTDEELKWIINAAPVNVPHVDPVVQAIAKAPKAKKTVIAKELKTAKQHIAEATAKGFGLATEMSLDADRKEALRLVRTGSTVTDAFKATGVPRRSIDRLIEKYGK